MHRRVLLKSQLMSLFGFTRSFHTSGIPSTVSGVLLVAAGYYAGGVVGAVLGYPPSGIASIWLPTAILLAGQRHFGAQRDIYLKANRLSR